MHPHRILAMTSGLCAAVCLNAAEPTQPKLPKNQPGIVKPKTVESFVSAEDAFKAGRPEIAWQIFITGGDVSQEKLKIDESINALCLSLGKSSPDFLIWVAQRSVEGGFFPQATKLIKTLDAAIEQTLKSNKGTEVATGIAALTFRGELKLLDAALSLKQSNYPLARAKYMGLAEHADFATTTFKPMAEVGVAECDRVTKNFSAAEQTITRLKKHQDPKIQAQAWYLLALIRKDQENYTEALSHLNLALSLNPSFENATIEKSVIQTKLKQYEEAGIIWIVSDKAARKTLQPGKPIAVRLEDKSLSTVGRSRLVEMRVWVEGGDSEILLLTPLGDSQTLFAAELPTALGSPKAGDKVLQVYGGQTVLMCYSKEFMEKNRLVGTVEPSKMEVVTAADFYASSGGILSREEQERAAHEADIKRALSLQAQSDKPTTAIGLLSETRATNQVKPGNPINLRVVDLDQDRSEAKDTVVVSAVSSSGDTVDGIVLTETGTHTGVFEGSLTTSIAPPIATSPQTATDSDPFAPIIPGSKKPWLGKAEAGTLPLWTVDLMDNLLLGQLEITATESGRKLESFVIQTSMDGKTYRTIARYPTTFKPWDGSLRVRAIETEKLSPAAPAGRANQNAIDLDQFDVCPAMLVGGLNAGIFAFDKEKDLYPLFLKDVKDAKAANALKQKLNTLSIHVQGAFVIEEPKKVAIKIVPNMPMSSKAGDFLFLVDGEAAPASAGGKPSDPLVITKELRKGVHTLDVAMMTSRGDRIPSFTVEIDQGAGFVKVTPDDFSAAKHPEIAAQFSRPTLDVQGSNGVFSANLKGANARALRLVLAKSEGQDPALTKITLASTDNRKLLPLKDDPATLSSNKVLEILPGDTITLDSIDPNPITEERRKQSHLLTATYTDARVAPFFAVFDNAQKIGAEATYLDMRRFEIGDTIKVKVSDPDMDATAKPDVVELTVRTSNGNKAVIKALESGDSTGVFVGTIITDSDPAKLKDREGGLIVGKGDDVIISYLDRENMQFGIPWERSIAVDQVFWQDPTMMVYDIKQKLLEAPAATTTDGKKNAARSAETTSSDILPTFDLIASETPAVKADVEDKSPASTVVGAPILVEIVYPWIAKSPQSTLEVFAQTSTGRSKKAPAAGAAFDIEVPGTISLKAKPGNAGAGGALPVGAAKLVIEKGSVAALGKSALDEGRFAISIPTALDDCPDKTLVVDETAIKTEAASLAIKPDDSIFVGVRFKDREGKTRWLTRELKQSGLATLDVLDRKMEETVTALHIGEAVYLRVLDFMADKSEHKDNITVELKAASGATSKVELSETFGHSGIFQGLVRFAYTDEVASDAASGVAVRHGDSVTLTYTPDSKAAAQSRMLTIHKGSNGDMAGFTKRFADPSIAVRTQFAIAESYFELAKRQRDQTTELKKVAGKEKQAEEAASLARRQIAMGKKILDEVVHDYPDSDIQLQTDYLRGNLELEYAADDQDPTERMKRYNDALTLFAGILANHQDSEYAPKAQFKKALCYERMGNIEKACEEYVRLSYRWPESELVAETIARLGKHFITMAKDSKAKGDALSKEDAVKGGEQLLHAYKQYNTAGEVLLRLKRRFPQNSLAPRATLTAGTAFILGKEFERAALAFMEIYKDDQLNDPNAKAEAMFRAGQNYLQMSAAVATGKAATGAPKPGRPADPGVEAYKVLTQLTWDFPDSVWAKHARGMLNSESVLTGVEKSIGK